MLATDYGNFYAFIIGAPALLVALLLVAFGAYFRQRWLHVIAGTISLLAGVKFFASLPDAKNDDLQLTNIFGWSAVVFAGVAILAAMFTHARPSNPCRER